MEEYWKSIKGYEGIYEVSNLGNVKALSRDIKSCYGCTAHRKEKIMSVQKDKYGYLVVPLTRNGRQKTRKVHRLVASSFIQNPKNLPCINHKDENKANNFVAVESDGTVDFEKSNLEWCTYKYNSNYGTAKYRWSDKNKKKVSKYDICGNLLATYNSIREAAEANNARISGISMCCSGSKKYSVSAGYVWRFITD